MIQSVIFDLDGTVLDNEPEWETAFKAVLDEHGLPFNHSIKQPNGWLHEPGLGLASNWQRWVGDKVKAEQLAQETVKQYSILSNQYSLKVRSGVEDLIVKAKERGWRTALCTSSVWYVVEKDLEELGMIMDFDVTTTGEEVMLLKPDPEIYTLTAQKLETDPESCLVIEDAIAGVRAGAEAGCQVIGLASDYAPEEMMLAAGAKFAVSNMDLISKLFNSYE
jgi:beta-phosphoglucomutase